MKKINLNNFYTFYYLILAIALKLKKLFIVSKNDI